MNDSVQSNVVRFEGRVENVIDMAQAHADREATYQMRGMKSMAEDVGMSAISRAEDGLVKRPSSIRLLTRLLYPRAKPEISYMLDTADEAHGELMASNRNVMCHYQFRCLNTQMLTKPSMMSIHRIFSDALLEGFSPHYVRIGDRYFTQYQEITKEQFKREEAIIDHRIEALSFTATPFKFNYSGQQAQA